MRFYMIFSMIMMTNFVFAQAVSHSHESVTGTSVVFSGFPVHMEDYAPDIQPIIKEAIEKYGEEEWRLLVLTSELHGHLGVYAIIGAKMGLYAREILGAGHDEMKILSLAGTRPPTSCLNDGLQVSTGATLGHGLIAVKEDGSAIPAAEFTYADKTIKIALKKDLYAEIDSLLKEIFISSEGLTQEYWQKVREITIQYWLEFDRHDIFEVN